MKLATVSVVIARLVHPRWVGAGRCTVAWRSGMMTRPPPTAWIRTRQNAEMARSGTRAPIRQTCGGLGTDPVAPRRTHFSAQPVTGRRNGVHGLLGNDRTGEWVTQTLEEPCQVAAKAAKTVDARVSVVVKVTHGDLTSSTDLAQQAASVGADDLMPGVCPTCAALNTYYREVATSTPSSCWMYDFPQESCARLQLVQVAALIEIPNVADIKQASRDERQAFAIIKVFGGQIVFSRHLLSGSGMAVMVVGLRADAHCRSGMLMGSRVANFVERAWRGALTDPGEIADQFARLMRRLRDLGGEGSNWNHLGMRASFKATIKLLDQLGRYPRRPKLPLTDPVSLAEIVGALREAGLSVVA